ncbi:MAG: hypothetical protein PW792_00555 [Acidobacteriaceae bacterium]|nr:hypothetical protein [Acidobacteriaceae bacterium]
MALLLRTPVLMLALATTALTHAQAKSSAQVKANGETRVTLGSLSHGATVTVRTHETKAPESTDEFDLQRNMPCTGGRVPCLLTDSLQIAVNGQSILLPYSAYADLGDMVSLSLQRVGKGYSLTIHGGDASVAYIAKLRFNRTRVLDRVVAPGEDSTQPSERTYYYNPKRFE